MNETYKCSKCGLEWKGWCGPQGVCVRCGSIYCEWLTYDPDRFTDDKGKPI